MSAIPLDAGPPSPLPAGLASALPDLTLALAYLVAWISPSRFAPGFLRAMLLTMVLEFIVVHSSAFMGQVAYSAAPVASRVRGVVLLGVFYTLFVGGMALAFHTWWPIVSFWGLTLNRATIVMFGQADKGNERAVIQPAWVATTLFYILGCMLTVVTPLPRLGFSPALIASLHLPGTGLWISQPWRAFAFGALYFGAVGAYELGLVPKRFRPTPR